jgi:hypothetical protein
MSASATQKRKSLLKGLTIWLQGNWDRYNNWGIDNTHKIILTSESDATGDSATAEHVLNKQIHILNSTPQ